MRIFIFFVLIFLSSCKSSTLQNNSINDFNFSKNMSLEEFKLKLKNYAEKNPYPNLNN
jgi:hypothetical protein